MPALLACGAAPAAADWGGAVAATSYYLLRGVAQGGGGGAVQLDAHARLPHGWFMGAWASTIPDEPEALGNVELNLYAGRGWRVAERWGLAARFVHYIYPSSTLGRLYDHDELSATLEYEDRLAFTFSASPNATRYSTQGLATDRRALAYEVSLRHPLWGPVSLVAAAGYYDTQALFGTSYRAWNFGLVARLGAADLTLARVDSDATAHRLFADAAADGRWVLTAAWPF